MLIKLGVSFSSIETYLEKYEDLYCIYVDIDAKESIRNRLNWHVNDPHTPSRVKNGTLLTLRQSIASILVCDQYNKVATDNFIDLLKIEYHEVSFPIKSSEAEEELCRIENELLSKHLYILNIQKNYHPQVGSIKNKLKHLRKISK